VRTLTIYAAGDMEQINAVDFNRNHPPDDTVTAAIPASSISHRCPHDIEAVVRHVTKHKDFVANGSYRKSVIRVHAPTERLFKHIIAPTQASKSVYLTTHPGTIVNTIQGCEGKTYPDVLVFINSQQDLVELAKPQWLYTAISRHTRTIAFFGDSALVQQFFCTNNMIPVSQDFANVNLQNMRITAPPHVALTKSTTAVLPTATSTTPGLQALVEDVIERIQRKVNQTDEANIVKLTLPKPQDGRMRFPIDMAAPSDVKSRGRCIGGKRHAKHYLTSDTVLCLQTVIGRYLKKTRKVDAKVAARWQMEALLEACDLTYDELSAYLKPTYEELVFHAKEYLIALEHKVLPHKTFDKIVEQAFETDAHNALEFFMKQQIKYVKGRGWDTKAKNGQGVSAWDKSANIVFSAYSRHLDNKLRRLFNLSGIYPNKPTNRVLYFSGQSEENLSHIVKEALRNSPDDAQHGMNDFSEWDSSNNAGCIEFETGIHKMMCMPPAVNQWYLDHRSDWTQIGISTSNDVTHIFKVEGHCKQHSGQPFTLVYNSLNNLTLSYRVFKFEKLWIYLLKGDDMDAVANRISINRAHLDLLRNMGWVLKIATGHYSEFASFYVSKHGLFPDVVRTCTRLLSKVVAEEKQYNDQVVSVHNDVSAVLDDASIEYNCAAIAHEYQCDGYDVSPTDIYHCLTFLRNFVHDNDWNACPTIETRVTYVNQDGAI